MRRAAAIVILACLPLCAAFGGDIYRSIDAQGHIQYSDTPTPGAVLVSASDASAADSADAKSSAGDNTDSDSSNAAAGDNDAIHQQLEQQAAARAVQKDTEKAQAQQCKQAQDTYEKSIEARRLYKVGKDGEREYLTEDQIQQQRVNYRLAVQAACKGAAAP
jgi:hypothetical protein